MALDRDNLLFYSGDPIDKIVYETSGSITTSSLSSDTVTHAYGKKVYALLYWTTDDSTFYSDGQRRIDTPGVGGDISSAVWAENDTNSCTVYFDNNTGGSQTATYYLALIEREI